MIRAAALLLVVLAFSVPIRGAAIPESFDQARGLFEEANEAYRAGDHQAAFDAYAAIAASRFRTREVLANAGNAAWQAGDPGRAVLFYERALVIDPRYDLARENLARIQPETNLGGEPDPAEVLAAWFRSTPNGMWAGLVLVALGLLSAAIAMTAKSQPGSLQRTAWTGRLVGGALAWCVAAGLLAGHTRMQSPPRDAAIVLEDRVQARLGPGSQFEAALELPAGTRVRLAGQPDGGWVRFTLRDGRSGFVESSAIERL